MIKPRDFLRYFLYSYIVTSAQLLGDKAPTLRRMVCKNVVKALLREHPELKDAEPVELVKDVAESFLGADVRIEEKSTETVVHVRGCKICPRDLIEEFTGENPDLEGPVFSYNVCAFVTMVEEILHALGHIDSDIKHDPIKRGRCRVIVRPKGTD
ncbi:hypothetical protein [Methanopyrus kandleri]|uniref:Uncharacterized protein n=2 Tax=Methanopyrus kandleri TaxID=2320 RepID=Q8TXW9_METKA|nr:hypothetical protein [Methanopyrus kandleri]AAM01755.1 Uncharacterized protein MK0540 [Methanopyrus kandleri AV19]HII70299.1 hypothetical protein [Methanopyrus kandleri]